MGELEKAYFDFEDGSTPKLPCMFNPDSLTFVYSNTWKDSKNPGHDVKELEFGGRDNGTLTLLLQFDTTDTGQAVTQYTDRLVATMGIASLAGTNEQTSNQRPQWVRFNWGQQRSFKAVVDRATVKFTYFSATGVPLRADVDLTLKQFMKENTVTGTNPTSGTPNPHRTHRVQRGETLDRISARYYGDSTRWRMLAAANGIEDPLAIRPGSLIGIPQEDG